MRFPDYITATGKTRTQVALELGFTPTKMTRLCADGAWPDKAADARAIYEWSGGMVSPMDFMGGPALSPPRDVPTPPAEDAGKPKLGRPTKHG